MKTCHLSRRCYRYTLISFFIPVILLFSSSSLCAHTVGESYVYLRVYEKRLTGVFHISLSDVNYALGLKTPDVRITEDNLDDRTSEIHSYYKEKVQFFDRHQELPIRFGGTDLLRIGEVWVVTEFVILDNTILPDAIGIDYQVLFDKNPDHLGLLAIEHFWKASIFNNEAQISLFFSPDNHRQQLSLSGYSVFKGFMGVVMLGIKHFWKGYDHLLFLIALVLPAAMVRKNSSWQPATTCRPGMMYLVKIITLFTFANSLALSIAAAGLFTVPFRWVASVMALSIAIAALEILFPIFKRKIVWVVFLLGLFHGFGFASVLTHMGVLGEHRTLSIVGFILGLGIGQGALVCILFPHLYLIRNSAFYLNVLLRYSGFVLIVVGIVWTLDRAFLDIHILNRVKGYLINFLV